MVSNLTAILVARLLEEKKCVLGGRIGMLCSDDGYPLKVITYQSKCINSHQGPLVFRNIKHFFQVVNDEKWYDLCFNTVFTTLPLLEDFKQKIIATAGKMQVNRLPGLPLPSLNVTEKKERGKIKVCSTLEAPVVRWVGNKLTTVASIVLV